MIDAKPFDDKEIHNLEYLESLRRSIKQLQEGRIVVKTMAELLIMEKDID